MKKEIIMIGMGSRPEGDELGMDLEAAEEADAEMIAAISPRGDFTSRGLDPLVKATNSLLPLFDQEPTYPKVGDTKVLPPDFVRILAMFKGAIDDAIEKEVILPEMKISLDSIKDDTALITLAGKLQMLAKDKAFKSFLKEPVEEMEPEEEGEMEEEEMSDEEEESFLMDRM
jgi:hypothetical protein